MMYINKSQIPKTCVTTINPIKNALFRSAALKVTLNNHEQFLALVSCFTKCIFFFKKIIVINGNVDENYDHDVDERCVAEHL